ncbi:MAG: nucleotidyl transferase, partial [Patescibacteria group bacterium]
GDHVKTGINSLLNSGTILGPISHVFGSDFQEKYIRPFSWQHSRKSHELFDLDKAIVTEEKMMKRRSITMTDELKEYLKSLHKKYKK